MYTVNKVCSLYIMQINLYLCLLYEIEKITVLVCNVFQSWRLKYSVILHTLAYYVARVVLRVGNSVDCQLDTSEGSGFTSWGSECFVKSSQKSLY